MQAHATPADTHAVVSLRTRYRQEMNDQIVHDSLHTREGWTRTYALSLGHIVAGFGSVAVAGPWKDKPTIFEFYLLPDYRHRAFDLFEAFVETCGAHFMEIQSSDALLAARPTARPSSEGVRDSAPPVLRFARRHVGCRAGPPR